VISIDTKNDSLFYLTGTVEHFEAIACKDVLKKCIDSNAGKSIILDISKLESVSSVTLSFLLYGLRSAKLLTAHLKYKNMSPALFNMARVSGIESILNNSNTETASEI
jgi:anti-anti-sigma factor